MPEGNSKGGSDSRSIDIRAARAQIEAARLRQQRVGDPSPSRLIQAKLPTLARYTILSEIHRGGQGIVYLAVQESTNRRVAVKILSRGPLAGSAEGLARFEREVESLSRLKHPNVVTIHDCGRDHDHVYLVMDYVKGRPLDAYIKAEHPSLHDTLELFAKICDGVNAAHLRGVIHRDLKPGNILVDDLGEPRVLDFGLAKPVDAAADSMVATMTQTGQFVGSLPWASPEQAEGGSERLDIRTDVYSLGVVLYQILTGRFPYPVSGNVVEIARHIMQTPPARPLTRSEDDAEIDRELETIVLKCLAKEPERRYQSAGEIARDLRRYLVNEPIEARRESLAYVMGKQLARYRAGAIVGAIVFIIVLVALIVSLTMWRRSDRHAAAAIQSAARADFEAEQARAVTEFMRQVLTSVQPDKQGADVRLVQVLTNASLAAGQRFATRPAQEAEVRELLGQVYDTLSMWNEATREFTRSSELRAESAGPDDPRTIESRLRLLSALINLSRTTEIERLLGDLMPRLERVYGPNDRRTLNAHRALAVARLFRGDVDEAERMLDQLRINPAIAEDDESQIRIVSGLIGVYINRSSVNDLAQKRAFLAKAEPLAAEWIQRSTRLLGPEAVQTTQARLKWAELNCGLGRYEIAEKTCRDVLDNAGQKLGPCHFLRNNAMYTLSETLAALGEDARAAECQLRRIECTRHQDATGGIAFLAAVSDGLRYLERAGLAAEGEKLAREQAATLKTYGGGHDEMAFTANLFIATFVSMQNRAQEAEELFRPLFASESFVAEPRARARLHVLFAAHLTRQKRFREAEQELQTAAKGVDDIRRGTWDTHPDDIIIAFIKLYQAWERPEQLQQYQTLREAIRRH